MSHQVGIETRKDEGKRLLGISRHHNRWKDNIQIYFKATGCEGLNCTELVQYRVQWRDFLNTIMNFLVQQRARNVPMLDCVPWC
jgi:hypothetical protein